MPITTSAKKALRSSARKRVYNLARKDNVTNALKQFKKLIAEKNKEEAKKALSLVYKALDKASKSGLLKKNTVSRKKSRLALSLKRLA